MGSRFNILSIQSSVAYGHVGNSAAVFPLQRIGVEVWPVNTVQFSNHTGYGTWRGMIFPVQAISEVIQGMAERQVLADCDGVLSGYMGDAALGEAVLEAVKEVRQANPAALYCCDPVMGDVHRGFFVREGIPEFFKERAVSVATIVTPNHFELEYLSSMKVSDLDSAIEAAERVRKMGPQIVLITSLRRSDSAEQTIEVLAVDKAEVHLIQTPLLPLTVSGSGDMTAALFFAHWLRTRSTARALEMTINAVYAVLEETVRGKANEIQLVAAQHAIADPPDRFKTIKVR